MAENTTNVMEQIVSLCKRRGFIYPASEIYGGINGFWDYGPLGVLLKNNIRDDWWRKTVLTPPIGPDSTVIVISSSRPSSLAICAIPSGRPMPRLTMAPGAIS